MAEKSYSNRELDEKFANLEDKMDVHFEALAKQGSETLEQTKKTNGAVANLKMWRAYMAGGMAVITLLFVPVLIGLIIAWASGKIV